jgi:hypothetical protein
LTIKIVPILTIGLFPIVPPDAEISFDLTLLGFKPRAVWVKPLVQVNIHRGLMHIHNYVYIDTFMNPYKSI